MHVRKRIGHNLIAGGVFIWLSLSVAVNFSPTRVAAIQLNDIYVQSNQVRTQNGVPALAENAKLKNAAQQKSKHMLNNSYFAHTAPDGTTGWDFINNSGYSYASVGENLASSNQDADSVVSGWLNSPGHRANLLNDTFNEVGYGSVYVGDWDYQGQVYSDTYFVVAMYGLSESGAPVQAPISNNEGSEPAVAATNPEQQSAATGTEEAVLVQTEESNIEAGFSLKDSSESGVTSRYITSGELPVASLAPSEDTVVGARTALFFGTLALTAILLGIILEVRWIKHHTHMDAHLPHMHQT